MQPLNHDMDDLMRKAAAEYPVKPLGADWEKVAQQLQAPGQQPMDKKGYGVLKKLFLILPFLLAAFVCDRYFPFHHGVLKYKVTSEAPYVTNSKPQEASINQPEANSNTVDVVQKVAMRQMKKRTTSEGSKKEASLNKQDVPASRALLKSAEEYQTANLVSKAMHQTGANLFEPVPAVQKVRIVATPEQKAGNSLKNPVVRKNHPQLSKLYLTALAGPDISRVKGQQLEAPGYSLGVLAGYRFAKKWMVESGLFWDRKNYYSKGAYFKSDNIYLPSSSEILEVEGYCDMFEIPVTARFYAVLKPRSAFVVSTGLSSYLMQKEDYHYSYERYNTVYNSTRYYKRASSDWFSIANISLAYEQQVGRGRFRVEPYLKQPLRGVGVGSLPLSSAGVLVGVMYPIR
jgi:hypothetical protein